MDDAQSSPVEHVSENAAGIHGGTAVSGNARSNSIGVAGLALGLWLAGVLLAAFASPGGGVWIFIIDVIGLGVTLAFWRSLNTAIPVLAHASIIALVVDLKPALTTNAILIASLALMFAAADAGGQAWRISFVDEGKGTRVDSDIRGPLISGSVSLAAGLAVLLAGSFDNRWALVVALLVILAVGLAFHRNTRRADGPPAPH